MRKINILVVTTTGLEQREGISAIILDYFSRFDKNFFEIDIIVSGVYSCELLRDIQEAGIYVRFLPSRKTSVGKYIMGLYKLFKSMEYDALYVHGSSAIMSIELGVAMAAGSKVRIAHSHNTTCDHVKVDKILRPIFYKLYTDAFACGEAAGQWLFGKHPYRCIKNGRDTVQYSFNQALRDKVRRKLKASNDELIVGNVGNFNKQKITFFNLCVF